MDKPVFLALDFETADYYRDSACAVGIVKVAGTKIIHEEVRLIRPPRQSFRFSYMHGITWADVEDQPNFRSTWLSLRPLFEDVEFLAAHNASFDRSVLSTCCELARIRPPHQEFLCTRRLARDVWGIYPTNLPAVCSKLRLPLDHHDPLSDARACAQVIIQAIKKGASLEIY
jgi:DNA polymerase-3 subunit epsilon